MKERKLQWDNAHDVSLRLNNTLVRYRGHPTWVRNEFRGRDGNDTTIDGYDCYKREWIEDIQTHDKDFDVRSPPLGYYNRGAEAYYAARYPTRRQQQGVSTVNVGVLKASSLADGRNGIGVEIMQSVAFARMIMDEYPGLEAAIKAVADSHNAMAFNRNLALARDEIGLIKLQYRAQPVGVFNKRKDKFYLSEQFEHYTPVLHRYGIDCEITE